ATATICNGQSYSFGGTNYTTAGIYPHTFTSVSGCDSIVTLTLNVNPTYNNTATATICNGQSYSFGGTNYTTAGIYPHTFTSVSGCDSIVTLTLNVNPTYNNTATATICNGQSYSFGGTNYTTAGTYPHTFTSVSGCDSIVTLTLNVNPTYNNTAAATICNGQSYSFGGTNYTTAGTYPHTFTSVSGCDSVVTLTLNVNPVYSISESVAICSGDSILIGGMYQTTAGTYNDTLTTVNGCDSVIITQLTVNPLPVAYAGADTSICNGQSITLTATGGTSYTWSNGINNPVNPVNPVQTTSYHVTVTDINNCSAQDSVLITVNSLSVAPTGITPSQNPICSGTPVSLSVNGGSLGTGASYVWYNGSCGTSQIGTGSSINITATATATYFVRAEGVCNSTNCANVTINVNTNLPVSVSISTPQTSICEGASVTFTAIPVNGGATPAYQWNINGVAVTGATNRFYIYNINFNKQCCNFLHSNIRRNMCYRKSCHFKYNKYADNAYSNTFCQY
ncbi:MAG: hypothetical protein HY958_08650, partial [Bacteroidia bacterium]|nr:hypothetical protein [Bacteroidia bacterium]